jgi:EAL domain-containing protein (putative c-di-GMP-specific phosphodiesterase class I)
VSGVIDQFAEIIDDSGIDPGKLTLEMTESVLMDDLDRFGTILNELRKLGVRIAVDDFGTGYSSLVYLKRLPFDTLKIDQEFIRHLGQDPYDGAIVASALAIARAMRLSVVAEGVETEAQLSELRNMRCDSIQGFFVAEPLPEPEFRSLVLSGKTW